MEPGICQDFPPSRLIAKIKQEPKEEAEKEDHHYEKPEPDYHVTRSLILRFVRDRNGRYSVVPHIKPDPFFEENLDDLCNENEDTSVKVKSEEGHHPNDDHDDNFNIKQENLDGDGKSAKNEEDLGTEGPQNETNVNYSLRCPKCSYRNTRKQVKRHIQRVHVTCTKHACPFCHRKNFKEPMSVDCHILRNHRDRDGAIKSIRRTIFDCTFCHYKTLKRNNFRRHLTTHGESRLRKQLNSNEDEMRRIVGANSKHEMKMALSRTKYDCSHCPYTTKDKGSIIKHLRLHKETARLPFHCKVCKKNFNEKNSLDSHIVKRHIDNKELLQLVTNRVYECELCDYKDVNKNKVIRHKSARHVKKERKRRTMRKGNIRLKIL